MGHKTGPLDFTLDPGNSVKRRKDLNKARKLAREVIDNHVKFQKMMHGLFNAVKTTCWKLSPNNRQTFANMDMENSYKSLFELLWNSQLPCFDVRNVTSKNNHEYGKLKQTCFREPFFTHYVFRNAQMVFLERRHTQLSEYFHFVSIKPRHVLFIQHSKSWGDVSEKQI